MPSVFFHPIRIPMPRKIYQKNWGEKPSKGTLLKLMQGIYTEYDLFYVLVFLPVILVYRKRGGFSDAPGKPCFMKFSALSAIIIQAFYSLENVKNYLTHDNGRTLKTTIQLLEDSGYRVFILFFEFVPLWRSSKKRTCIFCLLSKG